MPTSTAVESVLAEPEPASVGRATRLGRRANNSMSLMLYQMRKNDKPVAHCAAFHDIEQSIHVSSTDVGPSGSILRREHTIDADDGKGKIPCLAWTSPANINVVSYALVCEDIDPRLGAVTHHGIFYNIPSGRITAKHLDIVKQDGENKPRRTVSSWNYVSTHSAKSYDPPSPPYGHGTHRYVYTVVALSQELQFEHPDKVTKMEFHNALVGKVLAWGQWTGVRHLRLPGQTVAGSVDHPIPTATERAFDIPLPQ